MAGTTPSRLPPRRRFPRSPPRRRTKMAVKGRAAALPAGIWAGKDPPLHGRPAPPERAKLRRPRLRGYIVHQRHPSPRPPGSLSLWVAIREWAASAPPCRHQRGQPREAPGAWWSPWRQTPRPPRPGERRAGRGRAGPSTGWAGGARPGTGSSGINPGAEGEGRPGRARGAAARRREPAAAVEQAEEPDEGAAGDEGQRRRFWGGRASGALPVFPFLTWN